MKENKKLSVIVSCFNESEILESFYAACSAVLDDCGWNYELIFVDDGSIDGSESQFRMLACQNDKVRIIRFSRNFGHEAAMIAGIDYATGDGIICMDADLQHPPDCIPDIISRFEQGFDVVSMIRTGNPDTEGMKGVCSELFYKVLNALSPVKFQENASDYFGLSRRAAQVLRTEYRERVRYLRGYVQSIGFRCTALEYEAGKRSGGGAHYNLPDLVRYAVATLCGYSDVPLKLGVYAGIFAAVCGVILMIYSIVMRICSGTPDGYTTIVVALCFLSALTLVVLGIMGEYLSVLIQEVKGRPIYIVEETINFSDSP